MKDNNFDFESFKRANDEIMRSIKENMENRRSELFNASQKVKEAKDGFKVIDLPRPIEIHTLPIIRQPFFIPYDKKVVDEVTETGRSLLAELMEKLPSIIPSPIKEIKSQIYFGFDSAVENSDSSVVVMVENDGVLKQMHIKKQSYDNMIVPQIKKAEFKREITKKFKSTKSYRRLQRIFGTLKIREGNEYYDSDLNVIKISKVHRFHVTYYKKFNADGINMFGKNSWFANSLIKI